MACPARWPARPSGGSAVPELKILFFSFFFRFPIYLSTLFPNFYLEFSGDISKGLDLRNKTKHTEKETKKNATFSSELPSGSGSVFGRAGSGPVRLCLFGWCMVRFCDAFLMMWDRYWNFEVLIRCVWFVRPCMCEDR